MSKKWLVGKPQGDHLCFKIVRGKNGQKRGETALDNLFYIWWSWGITNSTAFLCLADQKSRRSLPNFLKEYSIKNTITNNRLAARGEKVLFE